MSYKWKRDVALSKKIHPCILQFKLTQNAFSLAPTLGRQMQHYSNKLYLPPLFLVKIKYNSGLWKVKSYTQMVELNGIQGFSQKVVQLSYGYPFLEDMQGKFT